MSESDSGKKQTLGKDCPEHWIAQVKALSQGKIAPKQLVEDSAAHLTAKGMIWSEVLGWVYPEQLRRASMNEKDNVVPTQTVMSPTGGKKVVITPKFHQEMNRIKAKDKATSEDLALARQFISTVDELFQEKERPF